jgi:hypothetical protein
VSTCNWRNAYDDLSELEACHLNLYISLMLLMRPTCQTNMLPQTIPIAPPETSDHRLIFWFPRALLYIKSLLWRAAASPAAGDNITRWANFPTSLTEPKLPITSVCSWCAGDWRTSSIPSHFQSVHIFILPDLHDATTLHRNTDEHTSPDNPDPPLRHSGRWQVIITHSSYMWCQLYKKHKICFHGELAILQNGPRFNICDAEACHHYNPK